MPRNVTRIYIGKISEDYRTRELEAKFRRYGRIRDIERGRNHTFIEYYDWRDADDAIYEMHGRKIDGYRIIVEAAKSRRGDRFSDRDEKRCYNCSKTGHIARNCTASTTPRSSRREVPERRRSSTSE
jgi:RNA recognition motif-containing protein